MINHWKTIHINVNTIARERFKQWFSTLMLDSFVVLYVVEFLNESY